MDRLRPPEHRFGARARGGAVVIRSAALLIMRIERIEIRNYRCLQRTVLADLPLMAVIVGANGAGKSTLFDVFSFLQESLTSNVAVAVARRGGLAELRTRAQPGPVVITIDFRESGGRLATYILEIAEDSRRVVIRTTSHIAKEAMTACLNNSASRTSWRWQRFG